MKSLEHIRIPTLIAGTALLLTGLQASAAGYKLADKAGASIAEFRDEIVDVKKEVDATLASLDKIVAQATVDPRKAFKEFDKNVPRIDSAATKAKKRGTEMKEKGKDYFDKWEKELGAVNDRTSANWPRSAKPSCRPRSPTSGNPWSRPATSSPAGWRA